MKIFLKFRFYFLILLLSTTNLYSQYYFYKPVDYGSESYFNPIGVLLNGGLDVLQSYQSSTRAKDIKWDIGATSVWHSIKAPGFWINKYGWNKFLRQEVLPTSLDITKTQWAPNYTLHLICGGMEYRKLSEWYDYNKFPAPFVFGAITAMSYHFINELVENGPCYHPNIDAIADLCIFDPLGIVLFSFNDVAEYFSETFEMNDWSPQASISLNPIAFRNFGHSFVLKYAVTKSKNTKIFTHLGKSSLLGMSFKTQGEDALSIGVGVTQSDVWEVDKTNGISTNSIYVKPACGFFYDRNNSLLASLLISEYFMERIRFNLYPGTINVCGFKPGVFFTLGDKNSFCAGITISMIPFGLGFYLPR